VRVVVAGFASGVHGSGYYTPLYKRLASAYRGLPEFTVVEEPFVEPSAVLPEADLYVALVLTGGVSGVASRALADAGKPAVLIAGGEHNALASALSIRARLVESGVRALLISYSDLEDYELKAQGLVGAVKASSSMRHATILEVNEAGAVSSSALSYVERFGGRAAAVSTALVIEKALSTPAERVVERAREVRELYTAGANSGLEKAVRVAVALEDAVAEHGADAVLVDCFPMILKYGVTPCLAVSLLNARGVTAVCEADYYSLPLMLMARKGLGVSGWIANPSGYTRTGLLRFAHCTMARDIAGECRLVEHFETGRPYGVACTAKHREVLFARFTRGYSKLVVYRGRVVESGMLSDKYCRSQVLVEAHGLTPEEFYSSAVGNHHVFIPDTPTSRTLLEVFTWLHNISLEYRS